jgi:nicotinate-nucleotide pyrophosphorylase (carboxylating)
MATNDRIWSAIDRLLDLAIEEDIGAGDVTTEALVPETLNAVADFVAREDGVLAGLEVVERLYAKLPGSVALNRRVKSGERFRRGTCLATLEGSARSILTGERTALNILQRMCGVATLAHRFVQAVEGTGTRILDTRKTIPGWRALDKLAVYLGGANNHRRGLYDMILIKDNHVALACRHCPGLGIAQFIRKAREANSLPVEVEVDSLEQLREALEAEPDYVLLDNMDPETLKTALREAGALCKEKKLHRPVFEASGGITLATARTIAETGVDALSAGAITHSAGALDIALDVQTG